MRIRKCADLGYCGGVWRRRILQRNFPQVANREVVVLAEIRCLQQSVYRISRAIDQVVGKTQQNFDVRGLGKETCGLLKDHNCSFEGLVPEKFSSECQPVLFIIRLKGHGSW